MALSCVLGAQLLFPAWLSAESAPGAFDADDIRAHVEFLADDLLEGRGTGTSGFDVAALYVAAQFRAMGLEPAGSEGWYQPVPLVERTPGVGAYASLSIGDAEFPLGRQALAAISGEGAQRWSGEAVFVGYGLVSADHDLDDYGGLDVRGKAVVFYPGAPGVIPPAAAGLLTEQRLQAARERGAAGVIILFEESSEGIPWSEMRDEFALPFLNWLQPDDTPFRHVPMRFSAMLGPETASRLFAGAPTELSDLRARAARGASLPAFGLTPQVSIESNNRWRRYSSPNVIGIIRGSDAAVADECILVTSHLDHLGVDPSVPGEDKIFNGALDNASGVAVLLEAARGIASASQRPRRSVLVAAVTAEEIGLLGSDYLAAHPPPGCDRVVAVVNLDGGVPLHELPEAIAVGGGHSTIGTIFDAVAAANAIIPVPDDMPPTEFFERTDHFSFARRGVPAVYLVMSGGDDEVASARYQGHYHQPSDDLTLPFNWAAGARFARLAHDLVRALADAPEAPRWYADSPIGQRYAKDQPKAARP